MGCWPNDGAAPTWLPQQLGELAHGWHGNLRGSNGAPRASQEHVWTAVLVCCVGPARWHVAAAGRRTCPRGLSSASGIWCCPAARWPAWRGMPGPGRITIWPCFSGCLGPQVWQHPVASLLGLSASATSPVSVTLSRAYCRPGTVKDSIFVTLCNIQNDL